MAKLEGQIQGVTNAFSQGLIPELVSLGELFTNASDGGQGFFKSMGGWVGTSSRVWPAPSRSWARALARSSRRS